jgi:Flp pilus assembly protein TadG
MRSFMNSRRPSQNRKGAIVVLVAFLLILIIAMVAFATDVGNITVNKTTLKAAADSAALAAAGSMTQGDENWQTTYVALQYGRMNLPRSYGSAIRWDDIEFGTWDPESKIFSATNDNPVAVRVRMERSNARSNPVYSFFGGVLNRPFAELYVESVAVGAPRSEESVAQNQVYVTSTKDLSNVVLEFADGTHQKFEPLSGYAATFQGTGANAGKEVVGVWIKSGSNKSSDGPGYGERIVFDGSETAIHGKNVHKGSIPHVTATFLSSGVTFSESGFVGPVRLVY